MTPKQNLAAHLIARALTYRIPHDNLQDQWIKSAKLFRTILVTYGVFICNPNVATSAMSRKKYIQDLTVCLYCGTIWKNLSLEPILPACPDCHDLSKPILNNDINWARNIWSRDLRLTSPKFRFKIKEILEDHATKNLRRVI